MEERWGPQAASCVQSSRCVISGRAVKRGGGRQAGLQIMTKLGTPEVGLFPSRPLPFFNKVPPALETWTFFSIPLLLGSGGARSGTLLLVSWLIESGYQCLLLPLVNPASLYWDWSLHLCVLVVASTSGGQDLNLAVLRGHAMLRRHPRALPMQSLHSAI